MTVNVDFDSGVFSLDAVKAACYALVDRFISDIELSDRKIICRLTFSDSISEPAASAHIDRLRKEVLDQDLRRKLKAETEPIRNLILAHAFSKTGLIGDE